MGSFRQIVVPTPPIDATEAPFETAVPTDKDYPLSLADGGALELQLVLLLLHQLLYDMCELPNMRCT